MVRGLRGRNAGGTASGSPLSLSSCLVRSIIPGEIYNGVVVQRTSPDHAEEPVMNDVQNKNVQNELRRSRRFCCRLVGCVGLFLVFVVDCRDSRVLELRDGSLILGVSAGSSVDYLWRSKDKGQTWDRSLACTVEGFDVKKQGSPWHAETVFWQAGNGDILAIARCHSGALSLRRVAGAQEQRDPAGR
ncbi:MAG: sialidase family protein [Planctomycetota bacterium]|nr:sialidase family protein [Planctomycetota bacterium]